MATALNKSKENIKVLISEMINSSKSLQEQEKWEKDSQ